MLLRLLPTIILSILLNACSGTIESRKAVYLQSQDSPMITVPADLRAPQGDAVVAIPPVITEYVDLKLETPPKYGLPAELEPELEPVEDEGAEVVVE